MSSNRYSRWKRIFTKNQILTNVLYSFSYGAGGLFYRVTTSSLDWKAISDLAQVIVLVVIAPIVNDSVRVLFFNYDPTPSPAQQEELSLLRNLYRNSKWKIIFRQRNILASFF